MDILNPIRESLLGILAKYIQTMNPDELQELTLLLQKVIRRTIKEGEK